MGWKRVYYVMTFKKIPFKKLFYAFFAEIIFPISVPRRCFTPHVLSDYHPITVRRRINHDL